jgi:hypothetical protein
MREVQYGLAEALVITGIVAVVGSAVVSALDMLFLTSLLRRKPLGVTLILRTGFYFVNIFTFASLAIILAIGQRVGEPATSERVIGLYEAYVASPRMLTVMPIPSECSARSAPSRCGFHTASPGRRVRTPTYPFQRQKYRYTMGEYLEGRKLNRHPFLGPRIESPAAGAIYAIDPDIPRERQRITLSARGAQQGSSFLLEDGRRAPADAPYLWLPQPGVRRIALVDTDGKELDSVRFEVRGLRRVRGNGTADERR